MPDPKLLTIVLNYKTANMTLRATEAARVAMRGMPGEIVIVDNDSSDGSFEFMQEHVLTKGWDCTRVVQSGRNGGYGAGNNVGINAGMSDGSRPDFVYVLNSDAFPEPNAIKVLYNHLVANPKTGFAGSYMQTEDGERHTSTFRFPSLFSEVERAICFGPVTKLLDRYRVPIETLDTTTNVDWLSGASLMMRQQVLDQIGLFDETFFLYFEETDLCRRVRAADYDIAFVPDSVVMHIGSVSTGMKTWAKPPDYWYDSRFHYFTKNHGRSYAMTATLLHIFCGGLHNLRCKLTGKDRGFAPGYLRTMAKRDLAALVATPSSRRPLNK